MEARTVFASGIRSEMTYEDLNSLFKAAGQVQKMVRVIGPDLKYTDKVYVVYSTAEAGTQAALQLSKGGIKVQALGEDKGEFDSLVKEEDEGGVDFMQHWQKFSTDQQSALMKMMMGAGFVKAEETAKGEAGATANPQSPSAASFFADSPIVVQEKPHLPTFSGNEKDCSFGRWKHEVTCIDTEETSAHQKKYTTATVMEAVRKSLKSPAADVLSKLGLHPTVALVIKKLESIYGSVLSGPAILEKFYKEEQGDKSCAKWSTTLEDLIYQAAAKEAVPGSSITSTLKHKFWSGLKKESIKNALRHRYEDLGFEDLVAEARSVEAEDTSQNSKTKSQQITGSEDSKLDLILKKMSKMEADIKQLQDVKVSTEKKSTSVDTKKTPVKCTKCQLEGHLYWGCRKDEDVTCHRCGAKGHMANSCRNKKVLNKE